MPLVNVRLIEGVFTPEQKSEIGGKGLITADVHAIQGQAPASVAG